MPTRVNPQWRRIGMVRLDRARYDRRTFDFTCPPPEKRRSDRGRQGFRLRNVQFADLLAGVHLPGLAGHEREFRAWLNYIRETVLQDCLQTDQQPNRSDVRAALDEVRTQTRVFLECAAAIGPRDWRAEATEPEGPLSGVFCTFPDVLDGFASHARFEAKHCDALSLQLAAFSEAADRLAQLLSLNFVSDKAYRALPQTNDYAVRSLADAVRIAQRLDVALGMALEQSKKCGGPVPKPIMTLAVVWLADLVEYYGGEFTHNPRIKTDYKGRPQTPAGRLAFKFLHMCDASIKETAVSQLMAKAVKIRNRRRHRDDVFLIANRAILPATGRHLIKGEPVAQRFADKWVPASAQSYPDFSSHRPTEATRSRDASSFQSADRQTGGEPSGIRLRCTDRDRPRLSRSCRSGPRPRRARITPRRSPRRPDP